MLRHLLPAVLSCLVGSAALLAPSPAMAQSNVTGQWARLTDVPMQFPVHNILLPNGKVFFVGRNSTQLVWDPISGQTTAVPNPGYDLFCMGHSYLPDGRILMAGGHIADYVGLANTSIYDPATNTWASVPNMNAGRWYPTVTGLPNGESLVVSGQMDTSIGVNPLPQVYQSATNTWRDLTTAQLAQPLYPMMFVTPSGKVVDIGPTDTTRLLDTSGTGSWSVLGMRKGGWRDYGSAAMYAEGKIVVMGGADPPKATAEVIDLNAPAPVWRAVASMSVARRHLNATLLPDGTVLASGGTSGPGHNNETTPVFHAELWNPTTETFTRMASASIPRLYHSSALLLPDGRVLVTGGDNYPQTEVFSPPYLFKGARPTVSGVPAALGYGQRITVQSPNAADIGKVTLIAMPSVTHAFDMNQRLNNLRFTKGNGTLEITGPDNANLAPPGLYMMFAVNSAGVPSVASIVKVGGGGGGGGGGTASCTYPNWIQGQQYAAGAIVTYQGKLYRAKFANPGYNPTISTYYWALYTCTLTLTPVPAVSSIAPAAAPAGAPAFTLTVNGNNFVSGSAVRWNGAPRTTTYVSATQLRGAITAADIAAAGTFQVSVANPGGAVSGNGAFTVNPTTTPPTCTYPAWVQGQQYAAGAIVTYQGKLYRAKYANPGYNPTISTYYWAPYAC